MIGALYYKGNTGSISFSCLRRVIKRARGYSNPRPLLLLCTIFIFLSSSTLSRRSDDRRTKKMFTGHVSVVAKEKRKKKEYNNKVFPIDSTNVILWLRFLFFFFFFNQEFERKREKKRWRVSTFSRCRITIGNALQGGVKKHRSAKKHYKGNNVVSSGCSTYSSVFFFLLRVFAGYFDGVFRERESESLFSKRWKMKFLFKIINRLFGYSYFENRKMPLNVVSFMYIYLFKSDSPMIYQPLFLINCHRITMKFCQFV